MQISQVFNQKLWPLAGDPDDCWVLAAVMAAHAVAPWLPLPTVREFRAAAGDPDDGVSDAGEIREGLKGLRGIFPLLSFSKIEGGTWDDFKRKLREGRVASLMVASAKLPSRMRYGFLGTHQITAAFDGDQLWVANPLAPAHSRWQKAVWSDIRPAAEAIGGVHAIFTPTEAEAFVTHPLYQRFADKAYASGKSAGVAEGRKSAFKEMGDFIALKS